jgi:NAD(P)-dependent dehydrogenase (short-subunit alcohol dehydrogenase family)
VGNALQDKTVVVGRGSGIARAVALMARDEGAQVIAAGRDKAKLADAYASVPAIPHAASGPVRMWPMRCCSR